MQASLANTENLEALKDHLGDSTVDTRQRAFCGTILLNEGISPMNYYGSILHTCIVSFAFAAIEILFNMVLSSGDYYDIPKEVIGRTSSLIMSIDLVVRFFISTPCGIVVDRFGRKLSTFVGFSVAGAYAMLLPYQPNIIALIFVKLVVGSAGLLAGMVPLLADYVDNDHKGLAAGYNLLLGSLSATLSIAAISILLSYISLGQLYIGLGLFIIIGGSLVASLLKSGRYYAEKRRGLHKTDEKRGWLRNIRIGLECAKHPWILMGYVISFIARGDSYLTSSLLVLWTKKYFPGDAESERSANKRATQLSSMAYFTVFLVAGCFGYLNDKTSPFKTLSAVFVSLGCALGALILIDDPRSINSTYAMIVLGVGLAGINTTMTYLIDKNAPEEHRGKVHGTESFIMVVGVFLCAILGSYLLDVWWRGAPFVLFIIATAFALLLLLIIYLSREKWLSKYETKGGALEEEIEDKDEEKD